MQPYYSLLSVILSGLAGIYVGGLIVYIFWLIDGGIFNRENNDVFEDLYDNQNNSSKGRIKWMVILTIIWPITLAVVLLVAWREWKDSR